MPVIRELNQLVAATRAGVLPLPIPRLIKSVLLGNGDGSFHPPIPFGAFSNPTAVTVADFNGDGKPDLAVTNAGTSNVAVFLNTTPVSTPAAITSPTPGSNLGGNNVIFTWSTGVGATAYWIDAGNVPGGNQYFQSGNIGNLTSYTVSGLPTNGSVAKRQE